MIQVNFVCSDDDEVDEYAKLQQQMLQQQQQQDAKMQQQQQMFQQQMQQMMSQMTQMQVGGGAMQQASLNQQQRVTAMEPSPEPSPEAAMDPKDEFWKLYDDSDFGSAGRDSIKDVLAYARTTRNVGSHAQYPRYKFFFGKFDFEMTKYETSAGLYYGIERANHYFNDKYDVAQWYPDEDKIELRNKMDCGFVLEEWALFERFAREEDEEEDEDDEDDDDDVMVSVKHRYSSSAHGGAVPFVITTSLLLGGVSS